MAREEQEEDEQEEDEQEEEEDEEGRWGGCKEAPELGS